MRKAIALFACAWFAAASAQYVPIRDAVIEVTSAPPGVCAADATAARNAPAQFVQSTGVTWYCSTSTLQWTAAPSGGSGLSGLTATRIPYATSATTIADDSAGPFWDATNDGLGIGTSGQTSAARKLVVRTDQNNTTEVLAWNATDGTGSQAILGAQSTTGAVSLVMRAPTWSNAIYRNLGMLRADSLADGLILATGKAAAPIVFHVTDTEVGRWTATGLGIGKTPATALDVNGTVTATAFAGPLTGSVTGTASNAAALTDGDKGDFTCTSGTCAVDAGAVTGAKSNSDTQNFLDNNNSIACAGASDAGRMASASTNGQFVRYCNSAGTTLHELVNLAGSQTMTGGKTFTGALTSNTGAALVQRLNDAYNSSSYADIPTALAALPSADGVLKVTPTEDDATKFSATNPAGVNGAGTTTGKAAANVVDYRNGQVKFLTSAAPPWGTNTGAGPAATEDQVPFVFQPRYHDSTDLQADASNAAGTGFDGARDGNSWSGGPDIKTCSVTTTRVCIMDGDCPGGETCNGAFSNEWQTVPIGHITGGAASTDRTYWYTGQCNTGTGSSAYMCPGPAIFQVRYPQIDDGDGVEEAGEFIDQPIFSVGFGGVAIYQPKNANSYYQSPFTIYHTEDSFYGSTVFNIPYFAITKQGLKTDGGTFMGNARAFPDIGIDGHTYDVYNAYVQKDVGNTLAAFVVEGAGNASADAEDGPLARFVSRANGTLATTHTFASGNVKESFGFYENSRLRLAAKCNVAGGTCTGTTLDSQIIEFEGMTEDANETRLGAVEPTGDRAVELPDASGVAVVAAKDVTTTGALLWGDAADATDTGTEVCNLAGLTCVDVKTIVGLDSDCATDQGTAGTVFYAMCRES